MYTYLYGCSFVVGNARLPFPNDPRTARPDPRTVAPLMNNGGAGLLPTPNTQSHVIDSSMQRGNAGRMSTANIPLPPGGDSGRGSRGGRRWLMTLWWCHCFCSCDLRVSVESVYCGWTFVKSNISAGTVARLKSRYLCQNRYYAFKYVWFKQLIGLSLFGLSRAYCIWL